jgi:hypothetical protein
VNEIQSIPKRQPGGAQKTSKMNKNWIYRNKTKCPFLFLSVGQDIGVLATIEHWD